MAGVGTLAQLNQSTVRAHEATSTSCQCGRALCPVDKTLREKGYGVTGLGIDKHGYLDFRVSLPGRDSEVVISFNGEVFLLNFRDGYHWSEFAMAPEEETDALADLLAFLDAYAHPATKEVEVKRRLRRTRLELHVSNGAVLSRHGWSKGPPGPVEP